MYIHYYVCTYVHVHIHIFFVHGFSCDCHVTNLTPFMHLDRESEAVEVPDPTAMLFCTFTGTNMKAHEALTGFALQLLDRVSRVKLSKEVRMYVYSVNSF